MPAAPQRRGREGGNVARQRLRIQRLIGPRFAEPADVVRWFGAVQAQDYAGALWAIGQRTRRATAARVEQAIAERAIVRTWPLRGTLHFTTPDDLRWMLKWLAPRMMARAAARFAQFELDATVFARCAAIIVRALEGGRQLSRPALYALFERAGISTTDNRGVHILFGLAHQGLICCGAREGKQHTFALLDEWLPPSPPSRLLDRDQALAELARRYFTSHAPATLADFIWWSGLETADARRAVAAAGVPHLAPSHPTFHTAPRRAPARRTRHRCEALLLPPYDEYTVAYRDRRAALDPKHATAARNGIFSPTIVINGRIAGLWTRRVEKHAVAIALQPFVALSRGEMRGVSAQAARYGRFLGLPAHIV